MNKKETTKKILCPAEGRERMRTAENWQYEDFACSQQKDVNDKTPTI